MKIHPIQTGRVRIKTRQQIGEGGDRTRLLRTLADHQWTEWLPIYAYLIEHDEGAIMVDTGETARVHEKGYHPSWHPYYRFGVQFEVTPEQEVGPGLESLGISPSEVSQVVLTHLHTDHAGGISHFPDADFLVSGHEWDAAQGWGGRMRGYLPNRWPQWFAPRRVTFEGSPYGSFPASIPITKAGDVHLLPTFGHTPGHVSVVVDEGAQTVFMAGDSSYAQRFMQSGTIDGVSPDGAQSAQALARTRQLAADRPVVYLPAHDPDAPGRLARREPVPTEQPAMALAVKTMQVVA